MLQLVAIHFQYERDTIRRKGLHNDLFPGASLENVLKSIFSYQLHRVRDVVIKVLL